MAIEGVTVEIGAETKGLDAALEDVNERASETGKELRQVERLLRFNPESTELLAQKQQLLGERVEAAREKLDRLRQAEDQMQQKLEEGEISQQQYREFQREIEKTESKLEHYQGKLDEINVNQSELSQAVEETAQALQGIGEQLTSVGKQLTKVSGAMAAGGAAAVGLAVKSGRAADELLDLESITGMSTDTLQEFQDVADYAGVSFDGLVGITRKFQNRLDRIREGSGPAAEVIDELGVSVEDANGNVRDINELFPELIQELQKIEDPTERNSKAMEIFGRNMNDLAPVLDISAEKMQELRENSDVIDREDLESANEFRQELDALQREMSRLFLRIGNDLAPVISEELVPIFRNTLFPAMKSIGEAIGTAIEAFGALDESTQKLIMGLTGFAAALGPVLTALGVFAGALSALLSPIGAVLAAIGGLSAVAIGVYRNWEEVKNSLTAIWDFLKTQAQLLATQIQIAFTGMRLGIEKMINAIVDQASVLSNLPGRWGDEFEEFSDSVTQSTEETEEQFENLKDRHSELASQSVDEMKNMGASFVELGSSVKDEVTGMVEAITGLGDSYEQTSGKLVGMFEEHSSITGLIEDEIGYQTDFIEKEIGLQNDTIEEAFKYRTQYTKEEIEKRKQLEEEYSEKLFQEQADRIEILEKEKQEALEEAEELGADREDIRKYYNQKIKEIEEERRQQELKKEEKLMAAKYELEEISTEEYKQFLQSRLSEYEKYSDEWMKIKRELEGLGGEEETFDLTNLSEAKDLISEIGEDIQEAWNDIKDFDFSIEVSLDDVYSKMQNLATSLGDTLENAVTNSLSTAFGDFSSEFESLISGDIGGLFSGVLDQIISLDDEETEDDEGISQTINQLVETIQSFLRPLIPIVNDLLQQLQPLAEIFGQILQTVGRMLISILEPLIEPLQQIFSIIRELFVIIEPLLEPLAEIVATLIEFLADILEPLMPLFQLLTQFLNILLSVLQPVIEALTFLLKPIQWLAEAIGTVANFFVRIIRAVIGAFNTIPGVDISKPGYFDSGGGADFDTDPVDPGEGTGDTDTSGAGGTQVTNMTGPTRDLFKDLLSPLANLNQLTGINNRIYNLLDERLAGAAAAAAGSIDINFSEGAIQIFAEGADTQELSNELVDTLEAKLTQRLKTDRRGGV